MFSDFANWGFCEGEEKMVESKKKLAAYGWWFDSQNNSITRYSPWLQSVLAELDKKTESMLKLIEDDADSFAKRAEMYYKKRPELVNIIEDLYRSHRSLALRYDLATKFDSNARLLTRHQTSHKLADVNKSCDRYPEPLDFYHDQDFREVEIDDLQVWEEETQSESNNEELMNLREEIDRLKEENKVQKEMLVQKDEEKREVIRQLSLFVDSLKQQNVNLKKRFAKDNMNKQINSSCIFSRVFWGKEV